MNNFKFNANEIVFTYMPGRCKFVNRFRLALFFLNRSNVSARPTAYFVSSLGLNF